MTGPLSYEAAGVDVAAAGRFVEAIGPIVRSTHGDAVIAHPSHFAGLIRPELSGMGDPLIAATCDGVGTKVLLASSSAHYEGLGHDLVAMNVNDLLPLGARPLLFLDYLAVGKLRPERLESLVRGMAAACREAHCALLGGETAEMPDVYSGDDIEMAGFAAGLIDAARLPDPATIGPGDVVLGLPSTGLHANGFSLARKALLERGRFDLEASLPGLDGTLGDTLRTPTAIYVDQVLALADDVGFKAAAHITGGGLLGRTAAMLPDGVGMHIDPDSYARPPIFALIAAAGDIEPDEMATTFNMGLGFVAIVDPHRAERARGWLHVGEVVEGGGVDLGYAAR
ncbi:MAG TPA: phosphoribosylformylglycinamidine cyclo-ligase [Acidimicrobiia bacterium]|nr:phosphoribosylformylglycinamidine cyclo-ligase [Acidimicrobiia bacterium]